jgi:crotonobetainyl-CoA:carnitine CoA-transferase CaiB-like acyl-CoA transferase
MRDAPRSPTRNGAIAAAYDEALRADAWRPHRARCHDPGVLHGVRVVDLSTEIAGPYCTKLLADAGADVVKVEPPGGDPLRRWGPSAAAGTGALFEFLNTSKRGIVGHIADAAVVDLCVDADLVVHSEPPGTFPVAPLMERHPGLVVVSISPFGQDGPWRDRPATEFTLQAECGSIASRGLPEAPPLHAGGRMGEWVGGIYAAVAAAAALREAQRSGHGEHIDVALLAVMSLTMNTYTSAMADMTGWPPLPRPTRTVEVPSIEPTRDGYVCFTTNSAQQLSDFLLLIGRPDQLEDERWFRHATRWAHRDEFLAMARAYTTVRPSAQVLAEAEELRIPVGPVGNGATVTTFDHFVARGSFVPSPSGRFTQPRVPYRISGVEPRPFAPAPALGEHDGAVGWHPRARRAPTADRRLPLDGVRILDLTAWWAGPAGGHLLALLGADVIKVESVTRPDLMRYSATKLPPTEQWYEWGFIFHGANNTKRGITLDLTRDEGKALLLRLVAESDALIENYTPRVMDNFGLTFDVLHEANPRLVMTRMPAYGLDGPWRERTGFAQTMEAITGMAWVTGWPDGSPVLHRGACDPLAGAHAVLATILALREVERTGEGRLVEATMIEAALNAAAEVVVEYQASGTLLGRDGNRGPVSAPQGVYPCTGFEEWIAIAVATDAQWDALRAFLGDPDWTRDPALATADGRRAAHDVLDARLAEWTADHDARVLSERLCAAGVPAGYVCDARDIRFNPQLVHRDFFETEDHPVCGPVVLPNAPWRFAGVTGPWLRRPAPTLGQHNDEVLGGILGLDPAELARLRATGVIGEAPKGA